MTETERVAVEAVAARAAYDQRFLGAVLMNEEEFTKDAGCYLGKGAAAAIVDSVREAQRDESLPQAVRVYLTDVRRSFGAEGAHWLTFTAAVQRQIVESEPESGGRLFVSLDKGRFVSEPVYPAGTAANFAEVARLMVNGTETTEDSVCVHMMDALREDAALRNAYGANPVEAVAQWMNVRTRDAFERCCVGSIAQKAAALIDAELAQIEPQAQGELFAA